VRLALRWRARRLQRRRRPVTSTWREPWTTLNSAGAGIEVARFASVLSTLRWIKRSPRVRMERGTGRASGVIHRWAEELVRLRSPVRIARETSVEIRDAVSPEWIREGGMKLVATLLAADPMMKCGRGARSTRSILVTPSTSRNTGSPHGPRVRGRSDTAGRAGDCH